MCRSAHSPSFAEFEATLFSMLMSLGCLFVALFLRIQHQSFDPDSYLKRTGGRLKTAARRILRTGFGKVAYWRSYIEPKNKKKGQGFSRKPKGAGRSKCGCQRHRGKACRNKNGKRKRRKKGDKSKNGRSITLVAIYTLKRGKDGLLHGPINKRIWGSYAPRSVMMDWAKAEVKRRGFDPTGTNVHIVSDGENSFIASTGPGTKAKREKLRKTIAYLDKRQHLLAYGRLIEQDLVIASGVIEGAVRYVIGERMDCSGMRWIEGRAEMLLHLRCIELNGEWERFFRWARDKIAKTQHDELRAVQIRKPP